MGKGILSAALLVLLGLTVGCQQKFTREHFDAIEIGVDNRTDVRDLLGGPNADYIDQWMYDDPGRMTVAIIYFYEDGRVAGKEWNDANRTTFEGTDPAAADGEGELREHRRTIRTYDD